MANPRDTKRPSGATRDLAERIAAAKRDRLRRTSQGQPGGSGHGEGMGRAVRLGSEFIAAILVGAGLGYLLDQWLGTRPWIMLVMLLVGFAAGILNVTRSTAEMNRANPAPLDADLGPDEDDEDK
jgi:ATP synthase protein I